MAKSLGTSSRNSSDGTRQIYRDKLRKNMQTDTTLGLTDRYRVRPTYTRSVRFPVA